MGGAVEAGGCVSAPARRLAGLDPGTRLYSIGDIHGRADLLADLQARILADAASGPPDRVVVYLGDYVDRGPDSRRTIELLTGSALPGFRAVHLLGNHEELMLAFLADAEAAERWLFNGGDATLKSYGVDPAQPSAGGDPYERLRRALLRRLPRSHFDFLRGLKDSHVEGGYLFAHAGLRPGLPLDRQSRQDLLWIREPFLDSLDEFGAVVVHGHTVSVRPEVRPNRIGIDTGAYATGRLTCLVLEQATRRFLATEGKPPTEGKSQ